MVDGENDIRIIGVIAITIVFSIAMMGVAWEWKVSIVVKQILAIKHRESYNR